MVVEHKDIVPTFTQNNAWWWAVMIVLCTIAFFANLIFIITVIYNRRKPELKTFVSAVIVTIAFLDVLDVTRILPILSKELYEEKSAIFKHVYCSLGVFHELAIAIFLVSISLAVCVQAGKDSKPHFIDPRASLVHKILIPVVILIAAGAAAPLFLITSDVAGSCYTCTNPISVTNLTKHNPDLNDEKFVYDLYSTLVTVFTYALPVLVLPLSICIAIMRTCLNKQCCEMRYKQPIGELIMTCIMCIVYFGTIVGVMLPKIDEFLDPKKTDELQSINKPLIWELGNNAIRPLIYFMTNPAVWDGLGNLCCRKKNQLVNESEEEAEMMVSPVTTV